MLDVYLGDLLVGTIGAVSPGVTRFVFDEEYARLEHPQTLSLSMLDDRGNPRAPGRSRFGRLPAFFSNALPEGRLRTYLAEAAGVDERNEEALLTVLGDDLPGAVIVRSTTEPAASFQVNAARNEEHPMRFSLAGVQLKFSALLDPDAKGLTIPVSGVGGDWIVKLPSRRFEALPQAEAMAMTFAARCGIDVPEHRLVPLSDIHGLPENIAESADSAYAIRRYDRAGGHRIHQEDFAQVLSEYDKYQKPVYTRIAEALVVAFRFEDLEEFLKRLVFNIAIANGDAHLKNFSVVYPNGIDPVLAPAYDLVPTRRFVKNDPPIPIFETTHWEKITIGEFEALARAAGASQRIVSRIVNDAVERIRAVWSDCSQQLITDVEVRRTIETQLATVPLLGGRPLPRRTRPVRAVQPTSS
ncbi:MAG TPA: HipA domain-containing protein [Candidatus Elarobacter sp.]|nr:HipA domain-containing protein [Candidatus Elarobacter sp.]